MAPGAMLVMLLLTIAVVYFVIKAIKKTIDGFKK